MAASGTNINITHDDTASQCSDSASTIIDGSVISTVPDKHGFWGGTQYSRDPRPSALPPDIVLRREHKWIKMLAKWKFYMEKRYRKVRERCRKGIPQAIRPRAWFYLCGAHMLMEKNPHDYQYYLQQETVESNLNDIRKDLHRQFPEHVMFDSDDKPGLQQLFNVLKAYSVRNPAQGFCQAQAPVAAFLIMHLPEEQAFWTLVRISENYLKDYYSINMEVVQRDALMLQSLLKRVCTPAYRHLKKVNAEPLYYCTEWFLCAFIRSLPWDTLLRVFDIFLCEGIKVLFKTALVILIGCLGTAANRRKCSDLCETLRMLRSPPEHILTETYLVEAICRIGLTEDDFQSEHSKVVAKLRKNAAAAASSK